MTKGIPFPEPAVIPGKQLVRVDVMTMVPVKLSEDDYVRALEQDGSIRGEGKVIKPGKCNFLNYSEVWV